MKTYKQLPIPEDTAWDRSTLYGRLHWRIRDFITSCHNLIKWFPTIWNDRDWDDSFILKILQKKIEFQRKELVNSNRHMRIELDNRDMTLALNLLERVNEEYYQLECMDYWDNDMIFDDVPDKPGFKSIPVDLMNKEIKVCKLPKVKPLKNKTIAGIRTGGLINICQKLSFLLLVGLVAIGGLIMGMIHNKPKEHKAADERNNGV